MILPRNVPYLVPLVALLFLTGCATAPKTIVRESCSATPEKPCPDVTCPPADMAKCTPAKVIYTPPPCVSKAERVVAFTLSVLTPGGGSIPDGPPCHE